MESQTLYPYQPMMRALYEGGEHARAIHEFNGWLKNTNPGFYTHVARAKPDLLNASRSVASGLAGLSDLVAEPGASPDGGIITSWGNQLLDLAKGYMAYDAQRDILKLNISRAERGLPPISSSSLAPQFNVGASPEVQQMGYLAIAGLVIFGIFSLLKKR